MTDDDETLRRIRAAIAYADRDQQEIADSLEISSRTLERWKATGPPRPKVNLALLARECGLPEAFFYADFGRLLEITERDEAQRPAVSPQPPGTQGPPAARRAP